MKVHKAEIITMNDRYLRDWVPSIPGAAPDAFLAEAESRITVFRDGVDQPFVRVTFHTDLMWAIRDGTPDLDVLLDYLRSLVGVGGAIAGSATAGGPVGAIVINGVHSGTWGQSQKFNFSEPRLVSGALARVWWR